MVLSLFRPNADGWENEIYVLIRVNARINEWWSYGFDIGWPNGNFILVVNDMAKLICDEHVFWRFFWPSVAYIWC